MNTTTLATIIARQVLRIEALTPALLPGPATGGTAPPTEYGFRRSDPSMPLRRFAQEHPGDFHFRRFDLWPMGDEASLTRWPATAREVEQSLILTVAYPTDLGFYGVGDLSDVLTVIESDAKQINDAVYTPSNFVTGQTLADIVTGELDRSFADIWFQEFAIRLQFYRASSV